MAFLELGEEDKGNQIFDQLIEEGKEKLNQLSDVDFFAKFGSDLTSEKRQALAHYMIALGLIGKNNKNEAKTWLLQFFHQF